MSNYVYQTVPDVHPNELPSHREEYDVTQWSCSYILCCATQTLVLDLDQMHYIHRCIGTTNVSKVNYGDIGTVDIVKCCCFKFLTIPQAGPAGMISPKCGCDYDLIDRIQHDIQQRIKGRGTAGFADRLILIENKLDSIIGTLNELKEKKSW